MVPVLQKWQSLFAEWPVVASVPAPRVEMKASHGRPLFNSGIESVADSWCMV